MAIGVIGKKIGMSRVFTETGESVPVTVIEVTPNRVTQVKEPGRDGYAAVQVAAGERKPHRTPKPLAGHAAKAGVAPGRITREFRPAEGEELPETGGTLELDRFESGQRVDISGITKGRGYAGTMKRWNFGGGPATHGAHKIHRKAGSIGQMQDPGRVFKGKKMAGQMGGRKTTQQNLEVVRVDTERNVLLVRGAIPGAKDSDVLVRPSVKA
ncbi:50S ribosomal protein L3 [Thiohalorhabdus denitrificans]|uniref:Large ribosomal subunit protein uL3 n=1 Tax=Thiohalorhabdus denitrificans TaxID=381306 RepID=A0A0P9GLD1_9GAMM|nr:50S ribosomal protein L3 [Thiohalorhabdus denitrificans]KPV40954.1 50S ribosomal protein L3 [Thiohalorhabdus denitrificans]SCY43439.1 LSU ribosomal protein L3P [Thiohalorhabdus denitrificans]